MQIPKDAISNGSIDKKLFLKGVPTPSHNFSGTGGRLAEVVSKSSNTAWFFVKSKCPNVYSVLFYPVLSSLPRSSLVGVRVPTILIFYRPFFLPLQSWELEVLWHFSLREWSQPWWEYLDLVETCSPSWFCHPLKWIWNPHSGKD